MEAVIEWIISHSEYAHLLIFASIALAGLNVPISADLMIIAAALIASHNPEESAMLLFGFTLAGCLLSAWLSYAFGRFMGPKIRQTRLFSKLLPESRYQKIVSFYEKRAFSTLLIGRFIPFGVRNAIFMTAGMASFSFKKFIIRDAVACTVWVTCSFFTFYYMGHNLTQLWSYLKTFNLFVFLLFTMTVIGIIWYKKRRKADSETSP